MQSVGITNAEFREPTEEEARLKRMKHLRVDDFTFAEMVPLLLAEGLISEHVNHVPLKTVQQGRRTEQRNAEICARCEHLIHQQWKRNVKHLSADMAQMLDALFVWSNQALKRAIKCESLVKQNVEIVTEKKRRVETKEGDVTESYEIETTIRKETRLYPEFMQMAISLRKDIARLHGVPVGDVGKPIDPEKLRSSRQKVLRYRERTDAGEPGDTATN